MKRSQLFIKTRKDAPKDEVAKSAQLMLRAGFINKQMAGVYAYTPLGLNVLNKVIQVIREEMNAVGGQELAMTALQSSESWKKSGRWDDKEVDVWFKTKLQDETEVGLGFTHEEPITAMMSEYIASYRDLPTYAYQFQMKFRNEVRAKSGIMRTREFIMKDLYSFSKNEAEHTEFYENMKDVYRRTFERLGIGNQTYLTFASGGSFSKYSHEFQTIVEAGEDIIYVDRDKRIAINEEVFTDEVVKDLGLDKDKLEKVAASEVGNIFTLGTRFSEALGLQYTDAKGSQQHVFMGSYGIGPARVMGVLTELLSDDKGMVWPEAIAPAKVYLVSLANGDEAVAAAADKLYVDLQAAGVEVIYDDRDERAGAKFGDADLIGCPYRITISARTIEKDSVELQARTTSESELAKLSEIVAHLS